MDANRLVSQRPLSEIWNGEGITLTNKREADIGREEADQIIMREWPQLIFAEVGAPLMWPKTTQGELTLFWKRTPKSAYYHTARSHSEEVDTSVIPNFILYASLWGMHEGKKLVLLEMVCWPPKN